MKKRTAQIWKRILPRIIGVVIVLGILYIYFFTSLFSIKTYDFVGVGEDYTVELTQKLQALGEQNVFFVLPGNSIFTYHRHGIQSVVREVLPNTQSISIYPPTPQTLRLIVTPYTPLFRKNDTNAIALDGTVYREIHDISNLPLLNIATTTPPSPGILQSLSELYPKISNTLFPVSLIFIDQYGDAYFRSKNDTSEIRIVPTDDPSTVWSTILSAIDTEPLKSKLQKERLLYIDARFGNKVFYRFTNGTEKAIIGDDTTHASSTTNQTSTTTIR